MRKFCNSTQNLGSFNFFFAVHHKFDHFSLLSFPPLFDAKIKVTRLIHTTSCLFISIYDADSSRGAGKGGGGYAARGGVTSGADGGGACGNITQDPFIHENMSWQVNHTCNGCVLQHVSNLPAEVPHTIYL